VNKWKTVNPEIREVLDSDNEILETTGSQFHLSSKNHACLSVRLKPFLSGESPKTGVSSGRQS
jgi:hypothetical protein